MNRQACARLCLVTLLGLAFYVAAPAHAEPRISGRLTLSGFLYSEQEQQSAGGQYTLASPMLLSFGDARTVFSATRLLRGHLDMRLDLRIRAAASANYERKFDPQPLAGAQLSAASRGYLGGPEFDLREVWANVSFGHGVALRVGRQLIVEADLLKIDGATLQLELGQHLRLLAFGGGAPNPFSRSLTSDYQAPCGSGVASLDAIGQASLACGGDASVASFGGGLAARYEWSRLFGSLGLAATGNLAEGAGGPLLIDPTRAVSDNLSFLQPPDGLRDVPRVYIAWMNQVQPLPRFDLFSDLVFDVFGAQGPQLTRAILAATSRLLRGDRLTLRFSYSFMSSLAINAFLSRQFYNRAPNGGTLADIASQRAGFIENNLTLLRTARHEGRLGSTLRIVRKLLAYAEGRLRHRSLLDGENNSTVYQDAGYLDQQKTLAGDLLIGLRDNGSLSQQGSAGLRSGASYLMLFDFRAQSHIVRASVGHPFWGGRVDLEFDYALRLVRDLGRDASDCQTQLQPQLRAGLAQLDPALSTFAPDCFGRRSGTTHELGLGLSVNPWRRLQIFGDYHFAAMLTDEVAGLLVPTVFMHTAFLRFDLSI